MGSFVPGDVRRVVMEDAPEEHYRNRFLATAMFNLKMVDTAGGGIRKLFHKEDGSWENDRKRIQEMDSDRYAERKAEGQSSAQRGISQGYAKEIVRATISVERASDLLSERRLKESLEGGAPKKTTRRVVKKSAAKKATAKKTAAKKTAAAGSR